MEKGENFFFFLGGGEEKRFKKGKGSKKLAEFSTNKTHLFFQFLGGGTLLSLDLGPTGMSNL